jgi:hypothetical protein
VGGEGEAGVAVVVMAVSYASLCGGIYCPWQRHIR